MWITLIWPDGRDKNRWVASLGELDQLIAKQRSEGLTADFEATETGGIRLRLLPRALD